MREIKFRVFDPNTNQMIDSGVGIDKISLYDFDGDNITELEGLNIMQYTGLRDKNGSEIYQGDIIKITGEQEYDVGYTCEMKDIAIVHWDQTECQYTLDVIRKRTVYFSDFESTTIDTFPLRQWSEEEWWIEYEVVGNIHENPELLN